MNPRPSTQYVESLSFLLSQVGGRSAQLFAERLVALGVSPRAFGVMSNLAGTGSQTQQQLADALGIHRNNMVGLIDEMEAAGWVRRHRSERDRRAFDMRLTAAGSALVAQVIELVPALDEEVGQGLSKIDRQTLVKLLKELAAALDLTPGVHPHLRTAVRPTPTRDPEVRRAPRDGVGGD
ncbi:MAG: MarR family winged helix-turn-helix transcriptional regulator [Aquihabitans sp.]